MALTVVFGRKYALDFNSTQGAKSDVGSVKYLLRAFVKAHLVVFLFIAISTEMLSLFEAITFQSLLAVWGAFLICSFLLARGNVKGLEDISIGLPQVNAGTKVILGAIGGVLLTTFVTALLFPPNTWDSMTYHMSRVMHWISHHDVSFYPTSITRQNYQMPLAEFGIMHLQVLTNSDFYANLIQWVSFLVVLCLAPLISSELGLDGRQQLISAVVVATLPMAILQASSTQNDLVVSAFLMSFVLFLLRSMDDMSVGNLLFCGASLGLALLSKGTAYIYGAALGLTFAVPKLVSCRRRRHLLQSFGAFSFIVIVALLLNAGHFLRNYRTYNHPLSTESKHYRNKSYSCSVLFSNVLRNAALHLGTPSGHINAAEYRCVKAVLGSQLNNPKTTWPGTSFRIPFTLHEDSAGNLCHMGLLIISIICLCISWRQGGRRGNTKLAWCTGAIAAAAVLYCWILKWQPWASRLHTPLFLLCAPLLAYGTMYLARWNKVIPWVIVCGLFLYSIPFALANSSRSLLSAEWYTKGRQELYFNNKEHLYDEYSGIVNVLENKNADEVGLYFGGDDWEYPLWALDGNREEEGAIVFQHVGVQNASAECHKEASLPLFIIATQSLSGWEESLNYTCIYDSADARLFLRKQERNNVDTKTDTSIPQ